MNMCVYLYHMCAGAFKGHKVPDSLELKLQDFVSYIQVLRSKPKFSARAESALSH